MGGTEISSEFHGIIKIFTNKIKQKNCVDRGNLQGSIDENIILQIIYINIRRDFRFFSIKLDTNVNDNKFNCSRSS